MTKEIIERIAQERVELDWRGKSSWEGDTRPAEHVERCKEYARWYISRWEKAKREALPQDRPLLDPDMPSQELRLHMGELTVNEALVARAAIRWANSKQMDVVGLLKKLSAEGYGPMTRAYGIVSNHFGSGAVKSAAERHREQASASQAANPAQDGDARVPESAPATQQQDCQKAFENWHRTVWNNHYLELNGVKHLSATYSNLVTESHWKCWQAAWSARQNKIDWLALTVIGTLRPVDDVYWLGKWRVQKVIEIATSALSKEDA